MQDIPKVNLQFVTKRRVFACVGELSIGNSVGVKEVREFLVFEGNWSLRRGLDRLIG